MIVVLGCLQARALYHYTLGIPRLLVAILTVISDIFKFVRSAVYIQLISDITLPKRIQNNTLYILHVLLNSRLQVRVLHVPLRLRIKDT